MFLDHLCLFLNRFEQEVCNDAVLKISELKLKFKQLDIPASILYARDIVKNTPKIRENKAACITCQHSNSVVLPPAVCE